MSCSSTLLQSIGLYYTVLIALDVGTGHEFCRLADELLY